MTIGQRRKKNIIFFSMGWENFAPDLFAAVSIALQQIYCDNVFLGLTYHWIKKKNLLSRHTTYVNASFRCDKLLIYHFKKNNNNC